MVSRVVAWIGALAALVIAAGCGKAEGGAEPIPQSEVPSRVASLICESMANCCSREAFPFDTNACKQGFLDDIEFGYQGLQVAYDAQAAGDCLAAAATKIKCGRVEDEDIPVCETIFRGQVLPGQPCSDSIECQRSGGQRVFCNSDLMGTGVCEVFSSSANRHGTAGEACGITCFDTDSCDFVDVAPPVGGPVPEPVDLAACYRSDGLWCNYNDGTCHPLGGPGDPCQDYEGCREGTFCAFDSGVCSSPREIGQPCDGDDQCKSRDCRDDTSVCGDGSLTAEQCANDFMDEPQPGGDPGSDPAPSPGAP